MGMIAMLAMVLGLHTVIAGLRGSVRGRGMIMRRGNDGRRRSHHQASDRPMQVGMADMMAAVQPRQSQGEHEHHEDVDPDRPSAPRVDRQLPSALGSHEIS